MEGVLSLEQALWEVETAKLELILLFHDSQVGDFCLGKRESGSLFYVTVNGIVVYVKLLDPYRKLGKTL